MDFESLFGNPQTAVFVVAAVAIVVFGAVQIVKAYLRHRERVEMIRSGMHSDAHAGEEKTGT